MINTTVIGKIVQECNNEYKTIADIAAATQIETETIETYLNERYVGRFTVKETPNGPAYLYRKPSVTRKDYSMYTPEPQCNTCETTFNDGGLNFCDQCGEWTRSMNRFHGYENKPQV